MQGERSIGGEKRRIVVAEEKTEKHGQGRCVGREVLECKVVDCQGAYQESEIKGVL